MIQDILPYQYDNHYIPQKPAEKSYLIITKGNSILLHLNGNEIFYPKFADLSESRMPVVYLFSISNQNFFALCELNVFDNEIEELLKTGYQFYDLSVLRRCSPKWLCFAGATANQLIGWYQKNKFCGRCGQKMVHDPSERMMYCEKCGSKVYPQICPAVIVGVTNHDRILMTRYSDYRDSTRYALIAGFAEIGETIEETVQREVMEEVGLKVKNLRYYKSQPWSFSDTLLFGFFCELDGSDEITMDEKELATAEWVTRKDMSVEDDGISLTYEMMMYFKNGTDSMIISKEI